MNTYYIVYKWRRESAGFMDTKTERESYEITTTDHDLNSATGLIDFIREYGNKFNGFLLVSWNKLSQK